MRELDNEVLFTHYEGLTTDLTAVV